MSNYSDGLHVFLPYCLVRLKDGGYVTLNREYKPVGFNTREWIRYEDYPISVPYKITPALAEKLSLRGDSDIDGVYLYSDGCVPTRSAKNWKDYQARLEILANLKFVESPA